MQISPRLKKGIIGSSIIAVAAIGVGVYFFITQNLVFQSHGDVTVISIPFEITVKDADWSRDINTEPIEGITLPMHTGTRSVTFSANGFNSETQEIEVKEGESQTVYVKLEPATAEAEEEIADDEKYGMRREDISGHEIAVGGENLASEHPIVNKLPILDQWFEVFGCTGLQQPALETDEFGICVTLALDNPVQRKNAMDAITATGEFDADKSKVLMNGEVYKP